MNWNLMRSVGWSFVCSERWSLELRGRSTHRMWLAQHGRSFAARTSKVFLRSKMFSPPTVRSA